MKKLVILAMVAWLRLSGDVVARADQRVIDRFLSEYPEAARKWEANYLRVRGTCQTYDLHGSSRKRVCENTFAADHGFRKVEIHRAPEDDPRDAWTRVYCMGPETAFILDRDPTDREFSVSAIEKDERTRRLYDRDFGGLFVAPFSILGRPLSQGSGQTSWRVQPVADS